MNETVNLLKFFSCFQIPELNCNSRGITPERKKVVKSKIELDLPFMVPVSDWYINFK
jgi:hypothetical protein